MQKPLSRSANLVVEDLDDELLIYDQLNTRAHCLSGPAAMVWRSCDGQTSVSELATGLGLEEDVVKHALSELESNRLLDTIWVQSNGQTRREFGFTAMKAGAAIGAGSMIYSIAAPAAAATITPNISQCLFYSAASCDGCTNICGCCCCCQGCSAGTVSACKICLPSASCSSFPSGCQGFLGPGNTGTCSSGPNCSATAPNGPLCTGYTGQQVPSGSLKCCFPACTDGQPTLSQCGNGSQPCNCTGEQSPCST